MIAKVILWNMLFGLSLFLNLAFCYSLWRQEYEKRREMRRLAQLPEGQLKRAIMAKMYSGFR